MQTALAVAHKIIAVESQSITLADLMYRLRVALFTVLSLLPVPPAECRSLYGY
jgi:hypothetical protein